MIPKSYIQEWAKIAPWQEPRQVEQDLIITRAIRDIYRHPFLQKALAFRGGTALNKLFLNPTTRYSEDIDLVQTTSAAIGPTIDCLREALDPWLGEPSRTFSDGCITLTYRILSDDGFPIRLKVEINSREHFSVLGLQEYSFSIASSWASGEVAIRTYKLEELLGTKMRALYQRRKGRDLYDLYISLTSVPDLNRQDILRCFTEYMNFGGHKVTKNAYLENMEQKLKNREFLKDMHPLLPKHKEQFVPERAYQYIREELIENLT